MDRNLSVGALSTVHQMLKTILSYAGAKQGKSDCTVHTVQACLSVAQVLMALFGKKLLLSNWYKDISLTTGAWLLGMVP